MPDILMPKLSESMCEGKLLRWNVEEGQRVSAGDVIAEVETDKANMEIETLEAGRITGIRVFPGDMVPVGAVMATLNMSDEDQDVRQPDEEVSASEQNVEEPVSPEEGETDEIDDPEDSAPPWVSSRDRKRIEKEMASAAKEDEAESSSNKDSSEAQDFEPVINASPLAHAIADERGVDLMLVRGSGRAGRITKEDVLTYIASRKAEGKNETRRQEQFDENLGGWGESDREETSEEQTGEREETDNEIAAFLEMVADSVSIDQVRVIEMSSMNGQSDEPEQSPPATTPEPDEDMELNELLMEDGLEEDDADMGLQPDCDDPLMVVYAPALMTMGCEVNVTSVMKTLFLLESEGDAEELLTAVVARAAAMGLADCPLGSLDSEENPLAVALGVAAGDEIAWLALEDARAMSLSEMAGRMEEIALIALGEELEDEDEDHETNEVGEEAIEGIFDMPPVALAVVNFGAMGVDDFSGPLDEGATPVLSFGSVREFRAGSDPRDIKHVIRIGFSAQDGSVRPLRAARLLGHIREMLEHPLLLADFTQ